MTTEIEKKFFDAFGIKPEHHEYCYHECKIPELANVPCDNTDCPHYRIEDILPEITDRILLELICIEFQVNKAHNTYGDVENLKEHILVGLRLLAEKCYTQVRDLFGVKDYAEPKVFTAFCNTESHIQQYECQVIINNIAIDGCLWQEIKYLHNLGIKTKGCCCGFHIDSSESGYIQVMPEQEKDMEKLGYKFFINEAGIKCFYPRTIITKERE